ncbi:hypothetical protein SNEBB_008977 [Seison nebaliae]|nr:hypothetical protein SNEBB_008977 [Seison nebaliae]
MKHSEVFEKISPSYLFGKCASADDDSMIIDESNSTSKYNSAFLNKDPKVDERVSFTKHFIKLVRRYKEKYYNDELKIFRRNNNEIMETVMIRSTKSISMTNEFLFAVKEKETPSNSPNSLKKTQSDIIQKRLCNIKVNEDMLHESREMMIFQKENETKSISAYLPKLEKPTIITHTNFLNVIVNKLPMFLLRTAPPKNQVKDDSFSNDYAEDATLKSEDDEDDLTSTICCGDVKTVESKDYSLFVTARSRISEHI